MHPELARLLHHACRRPGDPFARLVLADWLEEHGDEKERDRARFIRIRAQLAAMRPYQPERAALAREAGALLEAHKGDWRGELPENGAESWDFDRGLISLVLTPGAADRGQLVELAADPAFAWVCAVYCRSWKARLVKALAEWRGLDRIGHLEISAAEGLTARGLKPLLESGRLAGLRELDLERNELGDAGAGLLAQGADLADLEALRLSHNRIGAGGAGALAASPHLAGLASLDLDNNAVGDEGLRALVSSPAFGGLRALGLESNEVTATGARELARADGLPGLRALGLGYNTLRGEGVEALARSPLCERLEELSLRSANAGNAGAAALAGAPLAGLRHLDLSHNGLDPSGTQALSLAGWLSRLESLRLGGNAFLAEGARLLARRPGAWALRSLDLGSTGLGAEGVEALLNGGVLSGLEELSLGNNSLDSAAAKALARFAWPAAPPWLDLRHNRFSETDKALLRERFAGRLAV